MERLYPALSLFYIDPIDIERKQKILAVVDVVLPDITLDTIREMGETGTAIPHGFELHPRHVVGNFPL